MAVVDFIGSKFPPTAQVASAVVKDLVGCIREDNAWTDKISISETGERAFLLDDLPMVPLEVYHQNNRDTAAWLKGAMDSAPEELLLYVGFEAFYDIHFEEFAKMALDSGLSLQFSPLAKSSREYIQDKAYYEGLQTQSVDWDSKTIIHLGASHAMDRLLFQEDAEDKMQQAWQQGRLIVMSPELVVVDQLTYRAGLSKMLALVLGKDQSSAITDEHRIGSLQPVDYNTLDDDIEATKRRVEKVATMEDAFAELYKFITKYVEESQLDSPLLFDSGWESFHLYKSVSQSLQEEGKRIPWTRPGLINARNAAIGDALHSFYATRPESFPIVVSGDTAGLLAGGISMVNVHTAGRYGVVIIQNNKGMAIEDAISKRSVDGHTYQYEYVQLERKRDIFTLEQLKAAINKDVLASLRDHLWGVSAHRSQALVLNIDVQSLRKENAENSPSDALLAGRSFLDEDFGKRYGYLEAPRRRLQAIVEALHMEMNQSKAQPSPVKIQGCSAIEFMEIFSQLTITLQDKLKFLPTPTDLLATRTLLPGLLQSSKKVMNASGAASNFVNSNGNFSVFVSNAAFGLDGLNNLISTHLESGSGTLVHLAYDAADSVTHYSLIGQVHRNFGVRPATILPSLYRNHQHYEGQVLLIDAMDKQAPSQIVEGTRNPDVKAILVDMGAPNLTAELK